MQLNQAYENENYQALGLDIWNGTPPQVTAYKNETGATYPLCMQASNIESLYQTYYGRGIVIDQGGIMRYKGTGWILHTVDEIVAMVDSLLTPTDIEPLGPVIKDFSLAQNYPNPFNPSTNIRFYLPKSEKVTIRIYDTAGRFIRTLLNNEMNAGEHELSWNGLSQHGEAVAGGLYFYTMEAGDFRETKKMTLVR